jgi:hypothetical protein
MRSAYQPDLYNMSYGRKTKKNFDHPRHRSIAVSYLLGVGLPTGLSSGGDLYKQVACLGKVLGFAQKGIIHDVSGFNGGMSECVQIQWSGSI